jgi:hypothetical protein
MKHTTLIQRLRLQNLASLEVGEIHILRSYCRVLGRQKPLSEARKLRLFQDLDRAASRRRLVTHYLTWVVRYALDQEEPSFLLRRIEAGNRALLGLFQERLPAFDDLDLHAERAIKAALHPVGRETFV